MDRRVYTILAAIALATVGIGMFTTSEPRSRFFGESTRQFVTTTAMAWIMWWALVVGFAAAGSVETETPCLSDKYVGDGQRVLPTPKLPAVNDGSRTVVLETALTGGFS